MINVNGNMCTNLHNIIYNVLVDVAVLRQWKTKNKAMGNLRL